MLRNAAKMQCDDKKAFDYIQQHDTIYKTDAILIFLREVNKCNADVSAMLIGHILLENQTNKDPDHQNYISKLITTLLSTTSYNTIDVLNKIINYLNIQITKLNIEEVKQEKEDPETHSRRDYIHAAEQINHEIPSIITQEQTKIQKRAEEQEELTEQEPNNSNTDKNCKTAISNRANKRRPLDKCYKAIRTESIVTTSIIATCITLIALCATQSIQNNNISLHILIITTVIAVITLTHIIVKAQSKTDTTLNKENYVAAEINNPDQNIDQDKITVVNSTLLKL